MLRYLKLFPLLLVLTASAATAAPQSADAFLNDIYARYVYHGPKTGSGITLDKSADYRRYFTPDLVKIIDTYEAEVAKTGDIPDIDGDPFVDAQDWQITHLVIHADSQTAHDAKATVKFWNFKDAKTIHVVLANTPAGWRISDIIWNGDEGSMRDTYVKDMPVKK